MKLPIVNVFSEPFEAWTKRDTTLVEIQEHYRRYGRMSYTVNDKLIARISNHVEAASYMARCGADIMLEGFIDSFLDKSPEYKSFRQAMPSKTHKALFDFQKKYPKFSKDDVDREINTIGHTLSEGQYLFHGGRWPASLNQVVLTSPFSTSFCPQVALRNAEWRGKAYDAGQIDLFVLRAVNPETKIFGFRRKGTKMGNEKEVLFASGAKLVLCKRSLIRADYPVGKYDCPEKRIPIFVIEVDIS